MKTMKKLLSMLLFAGALCTFCSCSTDDEDTTPISSTQLFGTWKLVNDADMTIVTTLTFSNERIINYSVTNTAVNPTIPANCPTYTKVILVDPTLDPAYSPWTPATKEYTKEQGYFTVSGNKLTFWPQVSRTSTDGSIWTETPAADMTSMEEYIFAINNANVMTLTSGSGVRQTYLR